MTRALAAWAVEARARVLARGSGPTPPWPRGTALWVTARTSYAPRPLPAGFRAETRVVEGAHRRVAWHPGAGRPLLVVPGLYARLEEGLFVSVAARAAAQGRPVLLLEDRFAPATLAANPGPLPDLPALGNEVAALARALGAPDVLAFSAGVPQALWARSALHRLAAFSSAVAPRGVAQALARRPWYGVYYRRLHRRMFAEAGRRPPAFPDFVRGLGTAPARVEGASLLVHASDDPVAPVEAVTALDLGPEAVLCLLPRGGHLGFGALAGEAIYLLPFQAAGSRPG